MVDVPDSMGQGQAKSRQGGRAKSNDTHLHIVLVAIKRQNVGEHNAALHSKFKIHSTRKLALDRGSASPTTYIL
jgi:hypothetical protein